MVIRQINITPELIFGDSREIANSIISLLTRRQVNIRTKVRKIARENFSVEVVAKKYIDVFEDVLM